MVIVMHSLPLLLALLVHVAVAYCCGGGRVPKVADVVKPQVVNASLIVMQERRKPAPVQKPKAKPKAAPKSKKTEAKPAVKQQKALQAARRKR